MSEKWIGKTAVVTGASAGIGAAIFKELIINGINTIGLARRSEKIEEIIKELGPTKGRAFAHKCDVSDPKSVTETFKWIEEKFGVVHILINNAGIGRTGNLIDDNEETWHKMNEIIDVNIRGLIQCTRESIKLMKKSDDYCLIVNMNSIAGHRVSVKTFSLNMYPPSKFAVTAITETVRQELNLIGSTKIRVTSLSPGYVATDIFETSGFVTADQKQLLAAMPSIKPEDISHAVMFLLSTGYDVNITELTIRPVGEK